MPLRLGVQFNFGAKVVNLSKTAIFLGIYFNLCANMRQFFSIHRFLILFCSIGALALGTAPTHTHRPRRVLNVLDFGANPDGATRCTSALQRAIDSCAALGGGRVLLPAGKFLSGSLCLKSGVELHLAKGATLLGSTRRIDYDRNHWYALLLAHSQHDIALTGQGTIDGQGEDLAADVERMYQAGLIQDAHRDNRVHESQRPQLIDFEQCSRVRVEGLTLQNAACWVQRYGACDQLHLAHLRVRSRAFWNNDGIDLVDCTRTTVRYCDIDAADDAICLKSDRRNGGCDGILIERCTLRSSASALKFGTNSFGGFRNIVVRHLYVRDTYRSAVALEVVDGGVLDNVRVEHVRAVNTGNAFFLRLGNRRPQQAPGSFSRVIIRDMEVDVPATKPDSGFVRSGPPPKDPQNVAPASIVGLPGYPIKDVRLERIVVRYPGGADTSIAWRPIDSLAQVPERPKDYPEFSMFGELPAWGLYARHVEGLALRKVSFRCARPDYRQRVVLDDVKN